MKKYLCLSLVLFTIGPAAAEINVVATYPYIADLVRRIGGGAVKAAALAPGNRDPHSVVPLPSYIARVRGADLLVINGAELEIGWMPPIIRESHNATVRPGSPGFLDLSSLAALSHAPESVSRSMGDVHPSGNPHFALDPDNVERMAGGICERLCALDAANCPGFRKNLGEFRVAWSRHTALLKQRMSAAKGMKIVQYHRLFNYFCDYFGVRIVAELEPLPGIPPASGHIREVIGIVRAESVGVIVSDVYHPADAARFVAEKTGARLVILPHDVFATDDAGDIFRLYEAIVRRLLGD